MTAAVHFVFSGEINCDSFAEFALHRARRLDLRLEFDACDARSAALTVAGQYALVDMFEMACSLGPYDCVIRDVVRADAELADIPDSKD